MDRKTSVMLASGLCALAGLWLIVAPFAFPHPIQNVFWNTIVVGAAVAVLAAVQFFTVQGGNYRLAWLGWVNAVLGFWMLASPFILAFDANSNEGWNAIIVGIVVIALGAWSGFASTAMAREAPASGTTSATA